MNFFLPIFLFERRQSINLMIFYNSKLNDINKKLHGNLISKNFKNDQNIHIKAKLAILSGLPGTVAILSLVRASSPVNTLSQNFDFNR